VKRIYNYLYNKNIMKVLFFLFIFIGSITVMNGQGTVMGTWKTVDDQTGEPKSYVEIFEQEGKVYGKITRLLSAGQDAVCDACKGNQKNKPIRGMTIIEDLEPEGEEFKGGKILDPESGNTYKCKIWLSEEDPDVLNVRGIHWTGLYRTQTWSRVKD
jgi:uncharacterized protein (DUF2147 family)